MQRRARSVKSEPRPCQKQLFDPLNIRSSLLLIYPLHGTYAAHIGLQALSKTGFSCQFEAAHMPVGVGDSEVASVYFPIPVIGD